MNKTAVVSVLMRIVLGVIFVAHAVSKFQMGLENVSGWFGSLGIPGFLGYIVAYIELLGGIFLIVGFLTRYVSILLAIVLAVAVITVKLPLGLLGNSQGAGYELDLALFMLALYFIVADRTPLSLDQVLSKRSA
ncbi:putative oxidoreductase CatD [compost metagenome]